MNVSSTVGAERHGQKLLGSASAVDDRHPRHEGETLATSDTAGVDDLDRVHESTFRPLPLALEKNAMRPDALPQPARHGSDRGHRLLHRARFRSEPRLLHRRVQLHRRLRHHLRDAAVPRPVRRLHRRSRRRRTDPPRPRSTACRLSVGTRSTTWSRGRWPAAASPGWTVQPTARCTATASPIPTVTSGRSCTWTPPPEPAQSRTVDRRKRDRAGADATAGTAISIHGRAFPATRLSTFPGARRCQAPSTDALSRPTPTAGLSLPIHGRTFPAHPTAGPALSIHGRTFPAHAAAGPALPIHGRTFPHSRV